MAMLIYANSFVILTDVALSEKSEDLMVGQILMLCVDGHAKAILDQFEEDKVAPQKYSVSLKSNSMPCLTLTPTARHT